MCVINVGYTDEYISDKFDDQLKCQKKCESSPGCIGIEYSYKMGEVGNCNVCFGRGTDDLKKPGPKNKNQFKFYRRPGISFSQPLDEN